MAGFIRFISIASMLTQVVAQFGLGGKRRQAGSSFEDLNEQAKTLQDSAQGEGVLGGLGDLDSMFGDLAAMQEMFPALSDPEVMKQMESMGDMFGGVLEELSKMDPQQLEAQMQETIAMLSDGQMAESIVAKKDEVLASLEQSNLVTPEELAKLKADPAYFEKTIRESFGQMSELFSNPDLLQAATKGLLDTKDSFSEFASTITQGLDSDEKIEEARLELLNNPEFHDNPIFESLFNNAEMKDVLGDAEKFRKSVKEGKNDLLQGAGVGEL